LVGQIQALFAPSRMESCILTLIRADAVIQVGATGTEAALAPRRKTGEDGMANERFGAPARELGA
jgi:hypothetical protein